MKHQIVDKWPENTDNLPEISAIISDPPYGLNKIFKSNGRQWKDPTPDEAISLLLEGLDPLLGKMMQGCPLIIISDDRFCYKVWEALQQLTHHQDVILHSELGRGSEKRWSRKHLVAQIYTKPDETPNFNPNKVPTTERKAPKSGYTKPKKIDSVWDHTMSNTDPDRVGWPTEKDPKLLQRFIEVHTNPGQWVFDPFAGSGSLALAAQRCGRNSFSREISVEARKLIRERLEVETQTKEQNK